MTKTIFFCAVVSICFCACSGKPSDAEIEKKVLLEYVCNETAKVNNLKILKTEETKSTGQPTVVTYTVNGEVEWPTGCTEMGTSSEPGTKEKFEKKVVLTKTEEGWQ